MKKILRLKLVVLIVCFVAIGAFVLSASDCKYDNGNILVPIVTEVRLTPAQATLTLIGQQVTLTAAVDAFNGAPNTAAFSVEDTNAATYSINGNQITVTASTITTSIVRITAFSTFDNTIRATASINISVPLTSDYLNITERVVAGNLIRDVVGMTPLGGQQTELVIPEGITTIATRAFRNAENLECITIASTITYIGEDAFEDAVNLSSVIFLEGGRLETIGVAAFAGTKSLTHIEIPASVRVIDNWAFSDSALESITFETGTRLNFIGNHAFFYNKNLKEIVIPASVTEFGLGPFINTISLTNIQVDEANTSFISYRGILFTRLKGMLIAAPGGFVGDLVVPSQVRRIWCGAFWGAAGLTSIVLPPNLNIIGNQVFVNCIGLTELIIPPSVTDIWDYTFSGTINITYIIIPSTVTFIKGEVFQHWTTEQRIYMQGRGEYCLYVISWEAAWREGHEAKMIWNFPPMNTCLCAVCRS